MLAAKSLPSVCLSCRLNLAASSLRNALPATNSQRLRSRGAASTNLRTRPSAQRRTFATTSRRGAEVDERTAEHAGKSGESPPSMSIEEKVRRARQTFGDALPRGHLADEEYVVYERLYGTPVFVDTAEEILGVEEDGTEVFEEELMDGTTVLLRKTEDGSFEEVEVFDEDVVEDVEAVEEEASDEREFMTDAEWEAYKEQKAETYHKEVYDKSMLAREEELEGIEEEEADDDFMRAHPLTIAGRSKPSPATVFLPKETFVDPIAELLTRANHKHLAESSNRILGGFGLPHSATTAAASLAREQKPIPLDPSQHELGNIESDVYMATVMPGTYASVMNTLVETRKRLGTPWIEHLLKKKGGPVVLDAGSGGAGILAWHEILKAEWQRMHEESGATSHGEAPLGKATVLTAANTLRHRASRLLEDTTFIPRIPDIDAKEEDQNTHQPRKLYDLIIAPHTLWPLKQEYLRKEQVERYWNLLNPKGGVLILLEKGLPRGFEVVAAARQYLLDKHIASPGSTEIETSIDDQVSKPGEETRFAKKETGMIIAPCTNHNTCPMYQSEGISQGRKDFCFFSQRYIRPPYLQRILNAKDRNHEDVQFSYVAVQRGRDQRLPLHDLVGKGVVQNVESTDAAFDGHEWKSEDELHTPEDINPLELPRLVLPALKRRGHVTLDVCTPAGTLERWTVPRSFSKQAFRDARKAQWGDLWALGAKTRIPKNVRLGRPRDEFDKKGRRIKAQKKQIFEVQIGDDGGKDIVARTDGRYQQDRKIRGSGGRKGRKKSVNMLEELD